MRAVIGARGAWHGGDGYQQAQHRWQLLVSLECVLTALHRYVCPRSYCSLLGQLQGVRQSRPDMQGAVLRWPDLRQPQLLQLRWLWHDLPLGCLVLQRLLQ